MKINTDILLTVEPRAQVLCGRQEFDYVDVVDFSAKPDISQHKRKLLCATKSSTEDDLTWYGVSFDRQDQMASRANKEDVLLVEAEVCGMTNQIVVPNVYDTLRKLHTYTLDVCAPKVVGVTGSVGKTTCVCMMEDLLSRHGKTLRLYAKRITPLSLFEMVINRLEKDTKYLVLEYAMYYKHHVAELVRLVVPTLGFLINLEEEHLGVDGISSIADIWHAKKALLEGAQRGYVEKEAKDKLGLNGTSGFECFDWKHAAGRVGEAKQFIKSELHYKQAAACLEALRFLVGDESEADIDQLSTFSPKENRLTRVKTEALGEVFFDGEVPCAARFAELSKTFYTEKTLVIHRLDTYEDLASQKTGFFKGFARFDWVYIEESTHRQLAAMDFFRDCTARVSIYSEAKDITPIGEVFVLWGMYWRHHKSIEDMLAVFGGVMRCSV